MAEIRVNATGELKLYDSDDSNYVSFKSGGTVSSNVTWTLPTADGSSGQVLSTNGSGTLSWATSSSADPSSADGDSLGTASAEWSDLYLADGGIVYFGNDQDIRLTHNADKGLIIKHSATADDKPVILTLQTGETDMQADDVIGKIEFQAPDEGTGTDAVLVSGAIQAVAEGNHSSSSNATRLEFMVGASEAAAKKMQLTSAGKLEVDGGIDIEGGAVFNEDSADVDFRVESNGDTAMLFVDGGNDRVGVGTNSPSVGDFHVRNTDDATLVYFEGTAATRSATAFIIQANDTDGGYDLFHAKRSSDVRFLIEHDGDCQNDNNSYGSTSDERIKQDITDANSQWDDIKALKIKNFKLKSDVASGNKIGVIAQDLETDGMSGLVKEHRPSAKHIEVNSAFGTLYKDGDVLPKDKKIGDIKTETSNVKTVKYSVLYMKAIKALQEAQTRIETLETKVKALEDA